MVLVAEPPTRGVRLDDIRLGSRTLQPRRQLLARGQREPLGKRALDILSVLAEARGGIVTKDELLEAVWPGIVVEENALQVHIVALRKALGPEAERLKTIRGVGYQLDVDTPAGDPADGNGDGRLPPNQPLPVLTAPPPEVPRSRTLAARLKSPPIRLALAALVVIVLIGAAIVFGTDAFRTGSGEPVSVIVRPLMPSGSGDATEAALAAGITDELIVRLRRFPGLRVASAGPDGTAPGASFKRAYTVDGTLRRAGKALRVTARLVGKDGEILWSQTFDGEVADLFAVQETIAGQIAWALGVSLDVGMDSTDYGGTDNPEAFAAYLQGGAAVFRGDPDAAEAHYQRATALDPHYAKPYIGRVANESIRLLRARDEVEVRGIFAKMDSLSKQALAAKPDLWLGHFARGTYFLHRRDLTAAEREMARARELDPEDDVELPLYLAIYELAVGRSEEADALMQTAGLIDPDLVRNPMRVPTFLMLGKYEEALALYNALPSEVQSDPPLQTDALWALLLSGKEAEAIKLSRTGDPVVSRLFDGFRAGSIETGTSPAELARWIERQEGNGQEAATTAALFASHYRHPTLAVDLMRLAFERPGGTQFYKLWQPAMAEARKTDAFEKLVTDLGFVEIWRESGDWGDYCRPVSATEITCH